MIGLAKFIGCSYNIKQWQQISKSNVQFGSEADIRSEKRHVRFTSQIPADYELHIHPALCGFTSQIHWRGGKEAKHDYKKRAHPVLVRNIEIGAHQGHDHQQ
jgi:hypothetical protein